MLLRCPHHNKVMNRLSILALVLATSTASIAQAQMATDPQATATTTDPFRRNNPATPDQTKLFDQQNSAENPDADAEDETPADQAEELPNTVQDEAAAEALERKNFGRENLRIPGVDSLRIVPPPVDEKTAGIGIGSMTLRPALTETVGTEGDRSGKTKSSRSYIQSGFRGALTSNWSRHSLDIEADATWQKTLSGLRKDDPEGKINATLKLDLSDNMIATLKAGYSLGREDVSAANAIANAATQAEIEQYTLNAELTRDLGVLRTTAGVDFARSVYGPAVLENGTLSSQADRNENTVTVRGRVGYELSPLLLPFIEASVGRTIYDNEKDALGYQRDSTNYALKGGLAADFGEKLRGELATGYATTRFEDGRLAAIDAWTIDGKANWSPQRGTDVELGLQTLIEPSTTAGASGSVAYTANVALTQAILERLTGRATLAGTARDYSLSGVQNQYVTTTSAGLTWNVSRSIDLNADVAWENTRQKGSPTSDTFTAGIGLTLKR